MALSTQLAALEKALVTNGSSSSVQTSSSGKGSNFRSIEAWRTVKNKGDECEVNGLTWWWCPKHKVEGSYDGLYVRHRPENHDEWQARKEERKKQNSSSSSTQKTGVQKLTMSDKLKSALMTKCDFSESEINDLLKESK